MQYKLACEKQKSGVCKHFNLIRQKPLRTWQVAGPSRKVFQDNLALAYKRHLKIGNKSDVYLRVLLQFIVCQNDYTRLYDLKTKQNQDSAVVKNTETTGQMPHRAKDPRKQTKNTKLRLFFTWPFYKSSAIFAIQSHLSPVPWPEADAASNYQVSESFKNTEHTLLPSQKSLETQTSVLQHGGQSPPSCLTWSCSQDTTSTHL